MSNLLIVHVIAKNRVMGEEREERERKIIVVTSDRTLFCRLQQEEEEWEREEGEASKWDKLINHVFCLCYKCFDRVMLMSYCMVLKQWVLIYCREKGGTGNVSHAVLLLEFVLFCFVHVEFCTNGVVFLMFGLFCRSSNPVEVSRWVNLCFTLAYVKICYSNMLC